MAFASFAPSGMAAGRLLEQAISYLNEHGPVTASSRLLRDVSSTVRASDTKIQRRADGFEEPYFVLSLEAGELPHDPRRGWLVGCGSRASDRGPLKVDFLVARPRDRGEEETAVAPIHLMLRINPAGILTFTPASNDHRVEVLMGTEYEQIKYGQDRAIISQLTKLRLGGRITYELLFSIDEDTLAGYLRRFSQLNKEYTKSTSNRLIDFVPSLKSRVFRSSEVCINTGTLATGAFGRISEGFTLSGELVAVKAFNITRGTQYEEAQNEFRIASSFENARYVKPALKMWCEHDKDISLKERCSRCEEAHFRNVELYISTSLAEGSFTDALKPVDAIAASSDWNHFFYQAFQGLSEIWSMSVIHRDITLNNLLVDSIHPPKVSITDFGKAIVYSGTNLYDTKLGPVPYVAPEVWAGQGYSHSIDLYSLALSIGMLYARPSWSPRDKVTMEGLESYSRVLQSLGQQQSQLEALMELLCSILQWRVDDRITLQKALEHRCWDDIRTVSSGDEDLGRKKQRLDGHQTTNDPDENKDAPNSSSVVTDPFSAGFYAPPGQ